MSLVKGSKRWKRPKMILRTEVLEEWIDQSPLSKEELAELLDIHTNSLQRYLNGSRNPSVFMQRRLSETTKIKIKDLFKQV